LDYLATLSGRPNTIATYTSIYKKWIEPRVKNGVKESDIHSLMVDLKLAGLAPRTQKIVARVFKDYLTKVDLPTINVKKEIRCIERFELPGIPKALTRGEAEAVIKVCPPSFLPVLLLGLHAGLRRGEVFGLSWEDVNLDRKSLLIKRSYDGPTKSGRPRTLPISPALDKSLRALYSSGAGRGKLFKPFNPNPKLKKLCSRAKVKEVNFHCLRHTFVTLALESGVSPRVVQDLAGHQSLSTTLDIYWSKINQSVDLGFLP
jgi:integrase